MTRPSAFVASDQAPQSFGTKRSGSTGPFNVIYLQKSIRIMDKMSSALHHGSQVHVSAETIGSRQMYRMGHRRKSAVTQQENQLAHSRNAGSQPASISDALDQNLESDALTGLASLSMLSLRLEEIYGHCEALGMRPSTTFALLVIEPDLGRCTPLVRDAVRVLVADEAARTFSHGETVAVSGSRLLVLAANTAGLPRSGVGMVERLQQLAVLKEIHIATWLEPLSDSRANINSFVLDVAF
jgi:hypothetical protein